MNAVAIIGSLRKDSVNRAVFNHYKDLAAGKIDLQEVEIGNWPHYNQDLEAPREIDQVAEKIAESDGIYFFSPEYNYSMPGVLKNSLDWLSRSEIKPFDGKPACIIGASPGNIGTARMQYHLRQVGVFLNLNFLNKPEVMIGQAFEKISDGRITDEPTIEFLKKHIQSFFEFAKS